jgi:hypothetical protein
MRRKYILSGPFIFLLVVKGFAQTNDSSLQLKISGYADVYYAYYTDSAGTGNYQKFPSISPRSNHFGLNTAQVSFQFDAEKARGIITFHFGDIAKSTWSSTFNNIMEAHAGIRLIKKIWLDAGFFRTHFGTEGLLPKENLVSPVSVNTFYEPYFEAGARLNYIPNEKWSMNIYVLNGYNMYEDNNNKKSLGMLLTYTPSDTVNIGYSNYIGDDSPQGDSISHLRVQQNLFFNYGFRKLKIQIGGDYAMQQHADITYKNKTAEMYSGVLGLKYQVKKKYAICGRGELFNDPQGFISGVILDKENKYAGYKLWGITLGAEYMPFKNTCIRIEGRQLQMDKNQEIFYWNGKKRSNRTELICNIGISF